MPQRRSQRLDPSLQVALGGDDLELVPIGDAHRTGGPAHEWHPHGFAVQARGISYGEFDHISWITMKTDGPRITNVMLDGVLPEDLATPASEETGVASSSRCLLPSHHSSGRSFSAR